MIEIVLKKQFHCCFASMASGDVFLVQNIEIPCAPFVGLELVLFQNPDTEIIQSICWDNCCKMFHCYVEPDKTYCDVNNFSLRATKKQMDELVKPYFKAGWELEEV